MVTQNTLSDLESILIVCLLVFSIIIRHDGILQVEISSLLYINNIMRL